MIVLGKNPMAKGKAGDLLFIAKENESGEVTDAGVYEVGTEGYQEDVFYRVDGEELNNG